MSYGGENYRLPVLIPSATMLRLISSNRACARATLSLMWRFHHESAGSRTSAWARYSLARLSSRTALTSSSIRAFGPFFRLRFDSDDRRDARGSPSRSIFSCFGVVQLSCRPMSRGFGRGCRHAALTGDDLLNLDLAGNGLQDVRVGGLYDLQPRLSVLSHTDLHLPALPGVLFLTGAPRCLKSSTCSKSGGGGVSRFWAFSAPTHIPYAYTTGATRRLKRASYLRFWRFIDTQSLSRADLFLLPVLGSSYAVIINYFRRIMTTE